MKAEHSNSEPYLIIGAGGHGRVLVDLALLNGSRVSGFVDSFVETGKEIAKHQVLGPDSFLDTLEPDSVQLLMGIGTTIGLKRRLAIAESLETKGFKFKSLIAKSAFISPRAAISPNGAQILARAIVQTDARIESYTVINTGAIIEHDVVVERGSFIGPGAVLSGGVKVGSNVLIGSGAVILPGIEIQANAIIGGGAVVTKGIAENETVTGNPAKQLGKPNA